MPGTKGRLFRDGTGTAEWVEVNFLGLCDEFPGICFLKATEILPRPPS